MNYRIEITNDILVVRYIGRIDGVVVMEHIKDELFHTNLSLGKVIYDYSKATEILLNRDHFLSFARLAASQKHFMPTIVHAVVVNELIRDHAVAYKAELEAKSSWPVYITDTFEEALTAVSETAKELIS